MELAVLLGKSEFGDISGKGVPEGKKSMAVRVRYRRAEKTLTDEEITSAHEKIVKALKKLVSAEIR